MSTYYADEHVTLLHGDALSESSKLPDESVDCIVTSPPYYGLRDYGSEGQYGLEETPAAYVETMRALFSELRRALADDGTLWLNIGDSYGKNKNLLGIPWRVAFALQDDGWILRNSIIWEKPNAMPESVTDRLSGRHENIFMFSKSKTYWFDLDPIREQQSPVSKARRGRADHREKEGWAEAHMGNPPQGLARQVGGRGKGHGHIRPQTGKDADPTHSQVHEKGKNPGDVWAISTKPFPGSHFAVFPPEIPRRAIVAGCKPGGTVLDPFSGSGTTGLVAQENGRKYVGIDISADYLKLSLETRLQTGVLNIGAIA